MEVQMAGYIANDSQLGNIPIDVIDKGEMKRGFERRMLAYYTATLAPYIESKLDNTSKMKLLVKIAGALTEEEIAQRVSELDDQKKKTGYIAVLQELVDAYEDEDLDEYEDMEINGNKFTYNKGLDISPFQELFEKIGNDVQGNKWMVEIDSEGKAVLHE